MIKTLIGIGLFALAYVLLIWGLGNGNEFDEYKRGDGMSVLLNIAMPKTCEVCPCNDDNWRCGATKEYFDYDDMCERRRTDCPLIEVPPHGRLIDGDELVRIWTGAKFYGSIKPIVDARPTVIEAED